MTDAAAVPLRLAVLGTGPVGRALGRALTAAGHQVTVGTRDPEATRARPEWAALELPLAGYAELAADVFVLAVQGAAAEQALAAVGPALDGAVVVDTTNPLDFSAGFPPSLLVGNTDSMAERLQRRFPAARVVKMLNTVANEVMVAPADLPGETTLFVAGDDPEARETARRLAGDLGWTDVLDLGDLTGARGLESMVLLWVRLYATLGTPRFNVKVVR